MTAIPQSSAGRMRLLWLAVALALFAALGYLLIQVGLLGVGDL